MNAEAMRAICVQDWDEEPTGILTNEDMSALTGSEWTPEALEQLDACMGAQAMEQAEAGLLVKLWHGRWVTGDDCPACYTSKEWRAACWQKFKHYQNVEAGLVRA